MSTGVAIYPEEIKLARLKHWRAQLYPLRFCAARKKGMRLVLEILLKERGKTYKYSEIIAMLNGQANSFTVERALYELTHIKAICHRRKQGGYWVPAFKEGEAIPYDELAFWEGCDTAEVTITDFSIARRTRIR